jgi:hypothetical protein
MKSEARPSGPQVPCQHLLSAPVSRDPSCLSVCLCLVSVSDVKVAAQASGSYPRMVSEGDGWDRVELWAGRWRVCSLFSDHSQRPAGGCTMYIDLCATASEDKDGSCGQAHVHEAVVG